MRYGYTFVIRFVSSPTDNRTHPSLFLYSRPPSGRKEYHIEIVNPLSSLHNSVFATHAGMSSDSSLLDLGVFKAVFTGPGTKMTHYLTGC